MENPMIERQESDEEQTKSSSNLSDDSAVNPTKKARPRLTFPFGACRVCSDSATGIHYGIATCEGCKGFFKRSILRKEKYRCYFDNACVINVTNRNRCKACRFRRCLDEGMSVDGVKMGRIPKLVKERALKEQREQQMREKQAENQLEEGRPREASCSSSASDQSIENDDPNPMETDTSKFSLTNSRRTTDLQPMKTNSDTERTKINESSNLKTISKRKLEFLPDDFTIDETVGLFPNPFEPMPRHQLPWIRAIAEKFRGNPLKLVINLTQEETNFIDYIRQATYQTYLRHSKRVNQLECRMEKMIYEGIDDSLDDTTTVEEFLETVPKILEVIMRSAVFNVQELPGMHFMDGGSLQKLILHRAYDWFLLKYSTLLNSNGHCYFIAVNGFRYTRRWLNFFYGTRMTNEMFDFAQTLRNLNLTDRERALLLPLRLCHPDSTSDQEEIPRLLYSCYLSALHEEFKHHHGDHKSKVLLNKVLQVLDLLTPLADAYQKNVGSRLVQA